MSNVAGRKLSLTLPIKENVDIYHTNLLRLISELPSSVRSHRFIKNSNEQKRLLIVVSTDKGLVGPLNRDLASFVKTVGNVDHAILIGQRAARVIPPHTKVIYNFENIGDYPKPSFIAPIATLALSLFEGTSINTISIAYQSFSGVIFHEPVVEDIMPLSTEVFKKNNNEYFSYDSDPEVILEALVKQYIVSSIYKAVISAKASEHSARAISMQLASENATNLEESVRLKAFKESQRAVTAEIADTTNARLALNLH